MSYKSGTGLIKYKYNYSEKIVEIDFEGNDKEQCYRNDASVLFFCANSYRIAYLTLEKELAEAFEWNKNNSEKRSVSNSQLKHISHLILPYLFSFRHFLELELKAIYSAIMNQFPEATHDLAVLINMVKEAINHVETDEEYCEGSDFQKLIASIKKEFEIVASLVETYRKNEPEAGYYRYIFKATKKAMSLKDPKIGLDYNNTKEQFQRIDNGLIKITKELREIGVYVYFTL